MSRGGGVFASNNKEKKTMAMALDSSKVLSSSSHNCTTTKQQTTTTCLSMSSSSSSFSHFTLNYIKKMTTMWECSCILCKVVAPQKRKKKDDVGTFSLHYPIHATTKQ